MRWISSGGRAVPDMDYTGKKILIVQQQVMAGSIRESYGNVVRTESSPWQAGFPWKKISWRRAMCH